MWLRGFPMMKLSSLWHRGTSYTSLLWLESKAVPGVRFSIRKISLGQRIELSSRVRELTLRNEFLRAGEPSDEIEASMADMLVEKLYVEWAAHELEGLTIDGKAATVALVIERGPAGLVSEIASAIRAELELSEFERKN
jgi:hypothetical protein